MSGRFTQPDAEPGSTTRRGSVAAPFAAPCGCRVVYAWYELGRTWEEDEVLHGEYDFLDIRPESEPLERAA